MARPQPDGLLLPRPSPGPEGPGEAEGRRVASRPKARRRAGGCAPPLSAGTQRFAPTPQGSTTTQLPQRAGRTRLPPPSRPADRASEGARARETRQPLRRAERARGAEGDPEEERGAPPARGDGEESGRTDGRTKAGASRTRAARPLFLTGVSDKPLCRGLTFNRSQRGSCSATYETPTQKQVVYEWFSTRFPTNVRCVTGEGAAPFPAAPRFPGRGALRTGPRSRRAAGHATPRGARAAARRRGRRGTGYPRPTEAPRRCRIVPPGRDSDLEAFSHNPTDGSFAPLAPQPSTYTKCLNLRFLSY